MKKIYRLKKNHDIAAIVQKRQRVGRENYIVYYQYNNEAIPKVAFSVSKKYGKAFERNKAKRITREITRKCLNMIQNLNLVIVIKYDSKNVCFETLEKELVSIFKTIVSRINKGDMNENKKNI